MENLKGLPVEGYVAQSQSNIDLVNRNKKIEELILKVIDELMNTNQRTDNGRRWCAIAKTHIEQGFMALNRAVFLPERAKLLDGDKFKVNSLDIKVSIQGEEEDGKVI